MGGHMLPGRERRRAARRSMRFALAGVMAIPVAALIVVWVFVGATMGQAIVHGSESIRGGATMPRVAAAAIAGLAATLIATLLMAWLARRITRDVAILGTTARLFADDQLPELVARLRRGDDLDLAGDLPAPAPVKITEISRIAGVLAGGQRTTLAATASEIRMRNGISQVFVSLARRNQSLLQRQLRLIDDLERKAADPEALADLFPLDHLTTRMRRHAEGLIILAGASPGRVWSSPVPVIDIIRGAVAEVEDYKRVAVSTTSSDMLAGSAAADMIHLLAELIENACLFSPSGMRVEVRAEAVGNGFAFEVEDRGLGIKADDLDAINERLGSPADFDMANADQLGLFVVAKLAARHGVRVYLRPSPYGGTTAIVMLPRGLVTHEADVPQTVAATAAAQQAQDMQLSLTGRVRPSGRPLASGPALTGHQPGTSLAGPSPAAPEVSGSQAGTAGTGRADGALPRRGRPGGALPRRARPDAALPRRTGADSVLPGREHPDNALPRRPGRAVTAGTYNGLPRRVRQADRSPRLGQGAAPDPSAVAAAVAGHEPGTRTPEQARDLLASLQRGWERGRQDDQAPGPAAEGPASGAEHQEQHEEG